ncbi:hypothetical protein BD414DRAFT_496438 [Trametes punicea]|nr:hypothetical protein BD414DRAFT_496438 [Trametes punicea]
MYGPGLRRCHRPARSPIASMCVCALLCAFCGHSAARVYMPRADLGWFGKPLRFLCPPRCLPYTSIHIHPSELG